MPERFAEDCAQKFVTRLLDVALDKNLTITYYRRNSHLWTPNVYKMRDAHLWKVERMDV